MIKVTQEYVKNLALEDIVYKASENGEIIDGGGAGEHTHEIADVNGLSQQLTDITNDLATKTFHCFVANSLEEITSSKNNGDIAIINSTLATGKISKTAYCWNTTHWEALDGNYNASNVFFDENLRFSKQFGRYPANTSGYTIPSLGKSVKEVLLDAFYEVPVYNNQKYWGYRLGSEGTLDIDSLTSDDVLNNMHIQNGTSFPASVTYPAGTKQLFFLAPTGEWNKNINATDSQGGPYSFENNNAKYSNKVQINGVSYDLWYYTQKRAFESAVSLNINWTNA